MDYRNSLALLSFPDPLQAASTKPLDVSSFAKLVKDIVHPDFLTDLNLRRGRCASWLQNVDKTVNEAVIHDLLGLACRLHGLAERVPDIPGFWSEWASPLAARAGRMYRLENLQFELAMVYTTYAAAIRQLAYQKVADMVSPFSPAVTLSPSGKSSSFRLNNDTTAQRDGSHADAAADADAGATSATAAVSLLRQAAGVYEYLAAQLLPRLVGVTRDMPLELHRSSALCLQALCLGEAQAVLAARSCARGNSAGTAATLHGGCASLFQQAGQHATDLTAAGYRLSERLTKCLAASAQLHTARTYICMGADGEQQMELGTAEVCCTEANRLLSRVMLTVGTVEAGWKLSVQDQQGVLNGILDRVHKDRLSVTYQPLAQQVPDATAGARVLATAVPLVPQPLLPPPPPAAEKDKGCCMM